MQKPRPTLLSKLATSLLGKRTLMTLLDTEQIIKYQTSKRNIQQIKPLTLKAYAAWNGIIYGSVFSSYFIYYRYFNAVPWHSFAYLKIGVPLVVSVFYLGVWLYCNRAREEVNQRKKKYYEVFLPNFMEHLNILKFKYEINQDMQFQGVFNKEQLGKWVNQFLDRTSKAQR